MHCLAFHTKRLHHSHLAHGRKLLKRFGLTPARFDLLFVMYQERRGRLMPFTQSELCRILGVTSRTVSRMIVGLEKLRILARRRSNVDRREKWVGITAGGLLLVRRAVHATVHRNVFQRIYAKLFGEPERLRYRRDSFMHTDTMYMHMLELARLLGNTSENIYPTHFPDD